MDTLKGSLTNKYKDYDKCGRMVNAAQYERVCNLFKEHGGTVIIGNSEAYSDRLLKPTVILNPKLDSVLMKSKIYGPILSVISYKNIQEPI
jgi:acyl-CoA reductase-like NAD-dependent aldehyde dehydrogenase